MVTVFAFGYATAWTGTKIAYTSLSSYHAYVDESGATPGEFTGRKIRTLPPRYGHSTAVEITPLPDVAELGR